MNDTPPSGGHSGDIASLRKSLAAAVERSAAAHRETERIASEILDRLDDISVTDQSRRPEHWPSRPPVRPAQPPPRQGPEQEQARTHSPALSRVSGVVTRAGTDRDRVTVGVSVLGAVITVIGVVFLAVQAFTRGWLGPATAVTAGACLCLALIVASFMVHHRWPAGPTAPALLSVGVLGLFTDLWVLVFGLGWLSPAVGVIGVAATCAAGLMTAWWWNRQVLAVALILAGTGFLTPAVLYLLNIMESVGYEATSLLVLGLFGAAATWRRDWPAAAVSSAVVFVLGIIVLHDNAQPGPIAAGSLAGIAVMAWLSSSAPPLTAHVSAVTRWIPVSVIPVLFLLSDTGGEWSAATTAVVTLGLAGLTTVVAAAPSWRSGVSLRRRAGVESRSRTASLRAAVSCGIAAAVTVLLAYQSGVNSTASLSWMTALIVLTTLVVMMSDHIPVPVTWLVFLVMLLATLPRVAAAWITWSGESPEVLWPVVVMAAVPGALMLSKARTLGATPETSAVLAAVLLVVTSSAVPLIFITVSDTGPAFMAGHLVMSVIWMSVGVIVLTGGSGGAGLALAVLASAKLVFYDLSALSGLIQVAAFLICGVILLVAAVIRERRKAALAPDSPS